MKIETVRLFLRPLTSSDAETYVRLSQDEGFLLFQISNYQKGSVAEAADWILRHEEYLARNGHGTVGVFRKDSGELVGLAALKYLGGEKASPVELMYRLHRETWGMGYATEVGRALIELAFSGLDLQEVVATVDPRNLSSKKVLSKLGFQFKELTAIEGIEEELYVLDRDAHRGDEAASLTTDRG